MLGHFPELAVSGAGSALPGELRAPCFASEPCSGAFGAAVCLQERDNPKEGDYTDTEGIT